MYEKELNKDGSQKHSNQCRMAFGKKDKNCHRCNELINGAPSRGGWQKQYFEDKKRNEENLSKEIKNHDCLKSHCGPVCTAFEW